MFCKPHGQLQMDADFSSRYAHEEITAAIRREASVLRLPFPVFAILPGEIARDILAAPAIWPEG